jgi:hypothetical protein
MDYQQSKAGLSPNTLFAVSVQDRLQLKHEQKLAKSSKITVLLTLQPVVFV